MYVDFTACLNLDVYWLLSYTKHNYVYYTKSKVVIDSKLHINKYNIFNKIFRV